MVGTRSSPESGLRPDGGGHRVPAVLAALDAAGKPDPHARDFFARRSDGSAVVVDCRPVERRRPRDVAKFEATARACALAGWEYRLVGEADAW